MAVVGDLPPTDTTSIISIIFEIMRHHKIIWEHSKSTLICFIYNNKKSDILQINTNSNTKRNQNACVITFFKTTLHGFNLHLFINGFWNSLLSQPVLLWPFPSRHLLLPNLVCDNIHHCHGCSCSSNALQGTFWTKCKLSSSRDQIKSTVTLYISLILVIGNHQHNDDHRH